jgi:non-ribosomal peptide synthetase component F
MLESDESLIAVLRYNMDLFNSGTIQTISALLRNVLNGIAENPDRCISQLALLNEVARAEVIEQCNQTAVSFPARCVQQLFERQVAQQPNATALVFEDQRLSYRELNAARISWHIT